MPSDQLETRLTRHALLKTLHQQSAVPYETRTPTLTREPKGYLPETVLTTEEVAAWLVVSPKTVRTLGIKTVRLGHSTVRYLAKHVIEYMEAKAA